MLDCVGTAILPNRSDFLKQIQINVQNVPNFEKWCKLYTIKLMKSVTSVSCGCDLLAIPIYE